MQNLQNKLQEINILLENNEKKQECKYPFVPYVFSITFNDNKVEVRIYKKGYFYGNPIIINENSLERALKKAYIKLKDVKIKHNQIWM